MAVWLSLALALVPQSEFDRVVGKIEKAYAPIRSIVVEYEAGEPNAYNRSIMGRGTRHAQLRFMRGRYEAAELFWVMEMMGNSMTFASTIVRTDEKVFHKSAVFAAGEQNFLSAEKLKPDDSEGTRNLMGNYILDMTGGDYGVLQTLLSPRRHLNEDRVSIGSRTVKGRTFDTIKTRRGFRQEGVEFEIVHLFEADTGIYAHSEVNVTGQRMRVVPDATQTVAGVVFPKTLTVKLGRGRGFMTRMMNNSLHVRVLAVNSDDIPDSAPAWTIDPALPERTGATAEALLKAAEEAPGDASAQLAALNELSRGGLGGPPPAQTKALMERLAGAETDSALIHELAGAALLAAGKHDGLDERVRTAREAGKLSTRLALYHLRSLSKRDKPDELLKAFEACAGDPFTRTIAAGYEMSIRVRVARDAAEIAAALEERMKDLAWPEKLKLLDEIETRSAPSIPGMPPTPGKMALSSRGAEILDAFGELADSAALQVLAARALSKDEASRDRAAELYLKAAGEEASLTALQTELARFASEHPHDGLVQRLCEAPDLKEVDFLIRHAGAKFEAGESDAAAASVERIIKALDGGARLAADRYALMRMWGRGKPEVARLLESLVHHERIELAHRALHAAARSDPNFVWMLVEGMGRLPAGLTKDGARIYNLALILDPDAVRRAPSRLGLTPTQIIQFIRKRLETETHTASDAKHLASHVRTRLRSRQAADLVETAGTLAKAYPDEPTIQEAAGDLFRMTEDLEEAVPYYRAAVRLRPDPFAEDDSAEQDPFGMGYVQRRIRIRPAARTARFRSLPLVSKLTDTLRQLHGSEKALQDLEAWLKENRREQDRIDGAMALHHMGEPKPAFRLLKQVFLSNGDDWKDLRQTRARVRAWEELLVVAADAKMDYAPLLATEILLQHKETVLEADPSFGEVINRGTKLLRNSDTDEQQLKMVRAFLELDQPSLDDASRETARKAIGGLSAPFLEEREEASAALADMGPGVAPLLTDLVESRDAEVVHRVRLILIDWAREALRKEFFK